MAGASCRSDNGPYEIELLTPKHTTKAQIIYNLLSMSVGRWSVGILLKNILLVGPASR